MKFNPNRGLIRTIIIIIIAILILSYFGISIQSVINSPTTQNNFSYVWGGVVYVWNTYLSGPFWALWNIIVNQIHPATGSAASTASPSVQLHPTVNISY
ncbi:MAG TPA: hypothetical protein VMR73_02040 [Candidatus Paceibacterota bacterium]|nr:hypothetical protein [Candidatus Paceibacterota bacterium]